LIARTKPFFFKKPDDSESEEDYGDAEVEEDSDFEASSDDEEEDDFVDDEDDEDFAIGTLFSPLLSNKQLLSSIFSGVSRSLMLFKQDRRRNERNLRLKEHQNNQRKKLSIRS